MSEKDAFVQRIKDIHRIGSIQGHLGWDQETLMPEKGAKSRGEIMAWLAALAHERIIDSEMGELLGRVEQRTDLDEAELANTRELESGMIKQQNSPQISYQHLLKQGVRLS